LNYICKHVGRNIQTH